MKPKEKLSGRRLKMYEIVFESDTRAGRTFDIGLLILIIASVLVVVLESVESIRVQYGHILRVFEWTFTIIFTMEYLLRLWTVPDRSRYTLSFFGIIDLISILPTYLTFFFPGFHSLIIIRSIRLLRMFRILKLSRYVGEGQNLARALKASQHKITVFLVVVVTSVFIIGAMMYIIEGPTHGFTSIPTSVYWAIVTMTTVGYGDIAPQTPLGQTLASILMITGYGIIAVPTGIVSAEMVQLKKDGLVSGQRCEVCLREGHDVDAIHCKFCGEKLNQS